MSYTTNIPESFKLPLAYIYTDGSQAGNNTSISPGLLVGQKIASGTAPVNVPVAVGSPAIATAMFGAGSMLDRMATLWFANNQTSLLYCVPVADPTAGIAATGSIAITAIPTQSGVLYLYISGQLVSIAVRTTDTLISIASNLVAAINATSTLPVVATVDSTTASKVDLTCKWLGSTGNDIQISTNYLGTYGGQFPVPGFGYTITAMAGGNGQPDFTTIIANINTGNYVHVAMPYTDTASQAEWDAEYGFSDTGRWSPYRAEYGYIYNAFRADYADSIAWGLNQNSKVITTMALELTMPSPVWEVSAAYAAVGAYYLDADAARPLQTLELTGILPPLSHDRYNKGELNSLTSSGFAVQAANPSNNVAIVREALQYQFNAYGEADTAFALLTELSNLAVLNNRFAYMIQSKYPRVKLAPDGTKYGQGLPIVTPSILAGELINVAKQAAYDGFLSAVDIFIANLIVAIDDNNPNRVNILIAPQLAGQLRQASITNQFRLLDNSNIFSN